MRSGAVPDIKMMLFLINGAALNMRIPYEPVSAVPTDRNRSEEFPMLAAERILNAPGLTVLGQPLGRVLPVIYAYIHDLLPEVAGNPGAMAQIEFARREIEIFRKHAGEYGYEFFILQKKD